MREENGNVSSSERPVGDQQELGSSNMPRLVSLERRSHDERIPRIIPTRKMIISHAIGTGLPD